MLNLFPPFSDIEKTTSKVIFVKTCDVSFSAKNGPKTYDHYCLFNNFSKISVSFEFINQPGFKTNHMANYLGHLIFYQNELSFFHLPPLKLHISESHLNYQSVYKIICWL